MAGMKKKTVTILHPHYQPSKNELEKDMRVQSTPKKLAKAVLQDVDIRFTKKPKWVKKSST